MGARTSKRVSLISETHVLNSVVVPATISIDVIASLLVLATTLAMAPVARTSKHFVFMTHALKSVAITSMIPFSIHVLATLVVISIAPVARTTEQHVMESTKQHLCEQCH